MNAETSNPGLTKLLITIVVMSATIMQVLDTTIVNVALPHMQGSLNATPDQISWTLTSYIVASGIFMPLTGYFSDILGRKNYLLASIVGFTLASMLCGAAHTLSEIVIFRLLQGVFGAGLVPLSQAVLADVYSEADRGKAMAIWGTGVMLGPILGPTLGGYLTEIASWRWTFYVNVPIGILTLLLAWQIIPRAAKKSRVMDWQGLLFLSLAIGAAQYFLDRGNQQDWFNATDIRIAAYVSIFGFISFLWHSLRNPSNCVFDIKIFKNRNFTLASLLIAALGLSLYGTMVIQPQMLEGLLNYPVLTTGLVMAPRGISGMLGMIVVGRLINRFDARILISFGIALGIIGTYIGTYYSLDISPFWVIWPLLLQGFGLSLIFVPLSTLAFSTLAPSARVEAAGLFSLLRTIGSSVGISMIVTLFTRHTQIAWNQLGGFIHPYNPALQNYLLSSNLPANQPSTIAILADEVAKQAQMVAFVDAYMFITWGFILMLPLVWIIQKPKAPIKVPQVNSH